MGMKVNQEVADRVAFTLGIGGMIDYYEDFGYFHSYVTDDGRSLKVTKKGTYTLRDVNERLLQHGKIDYLLNNPNR
jgi:hypothetical protein